MRKLLLIVALLFVGMLKAQQNDTLCKEIIVNIDKFEPDTTYFSDEVDAIFMFKHKDPKLIFIAISFQAANSEPYYNAKGIYVLFKSGKKIMMPEVEIKTRVDRYGNYLHSGTFTLEKEHIDLVLNDEITDFRLYKEDRSVKNSIKLRNYLRCLLTK